jgi:hypothetical protein
MIYSKKIFKPLCIMLIITIHSISLCSQSTTSTEPAANTEQTTTAEPAISIEPATSTESIITTEPIRLSSLNYKSASVLPYYTYENEKWVILSRERAGTDKGTFDDFGGKKSKWDKHPTITAAREFYEEAILQKTIGLDLPQTKDFLNSPTTEYIISYSEKNACKPEHRGACHVTYIIDFNQYADQFLKNFYTARKNAHDFKYKEKDKIAIVTWKNFQDAIIKDSEQRKINLLSPETASLKRIVMIPALELQESGSFQPTTISLRLYCSKKLRPFFRDQPYQQGSYPNIRHYSE